MSGLASTRGEVAPTLSWPTTGEAKEGVKKKEMVARIKITRAMADLKLKFGKKFGVIKVAFSDPSTKDIIDGLQEASNSFRSWKWELRCVDMSLMNKSNHNFRPFLIIN